MKIVESPPNMKRGKFDWAAVAEMARANPGKWIELDGLHNPSVATQIRRGKYTHIKPEEFDITSRIAYDGDRRCAVLYVKTK